MSENLKPFIMKEIARRQKLELEAKIKKEELQRTAAKEQVLEAFKEQLDVCLSKAKDFTGFPVATSVEDDYPYFEEEAEKLGFEVNSILAGTAYDLDCYDYMLTVPTVKDGETPSVAQERLLAFQEKLLQVQKLRQENLKIECLKVKQSILACDFQVEPSAYVWKKIFVLAGQPVENPAEEQIVSAFFAELGINYSTCSKDKLNHVYWHFFV